MIRTFASSTSSLDWKKAIDGELKDMKNSFYTEQFQEFLKKRSFVLRISGAKANILQDHFCEH